MYISQTTEELKGDQTRTLSAAADHSSSHALGTLLIANAMTGTLTLDL